MSQKQELLERYEDYVFAAMMEDIFRNEEGKAAALDQRLQEDPDAAVPEALQHRCKKTIQKAFAVKTRKKAGKTLWRGLHAASLIVLILAATLTVSFAAVPELRINVLNMMLEIYETHTDFSFSGENKVDPDLAISLGWIPEGFVLTEDDSTSDCAWKTLENTDGATIHINKSKPVTISVDTENAQMETIEMQGYEATLITKNHEVSVLWLNKEEGIRYFVNTEWVPVDTMLRVAENVS